MGELGYAHGHDMQVLFDSDRPGRERSYSEGCVGKSSRTGVFLVETKLFCFMFYV